MSREIWVPIGTAMILFLILVVANEVSILRKDMRSISEMFDGFDGPPEDSP